MNRWLKLAGDWNRFWFRSDVEVRSSTVRMGLGVASLFAFIGHILFANAWLGSDGWLNPSSGLYLVGQGVAGTGAEYRWSVFYTYPNLLVPLSWVGAVLSGLLAVSIAPRFCAMAAFLLLAMFHHRAPLLMGRGEPLVLPFLLYSLLLPSTGFFPFAKSPHRWIHGSPLEAGAGHSGASVDAGPFFVLVLVQSYNDARERGVVDWRIGTAASGRRPRLDTHLLGNRDGSGVDHAWRHSNSNCFPILHAAPAPSYDRFRVVRTVSRCGTTRDR